MYVQPQAISRRKIPQKTDVRKHCEAGPICTGIGHAFFWLFAPCACIRSAFKKRRACYYSLCQLQSNLSTTMSQHYSAMGCNLVVSHDFTDRLIKISKNL